jgi:CRP/FNR family cyclic AMP-dependent transcriptional regulator
LVATPFFGGLSDGSLDLLISMLVERNFDVGATVVAEGEPGRSMYIIHSGELVVNKLGGSGRAVRMMRLGPGDFFGEMTLIEAQNRSATVVADSPTVLYGGVSTGDFRRRSPPSWARTRRTCRRP